MSGVKGLRPLRGARSAPLTTDMREYPDSSFSLFLSKKPLFRCVSVSMKQITRALALPALAAFVTLFPSPAPAQPGYLPASGDNQRASVTQQVGPVTVTVSYASPRVVLRGNDRHGKIWGKLVPYGLRELDFNDCKACPVAGRREREHRLHGLGRGEGAGQVPSRGLVRPLRDHGARRMDVHLLEERDLLGRLLVRPEGRRPARDGEARQERVPRVAHVRLRRKGTGEGDGRPEVGRAAGTARDRRRRRSRPLGRQAADEFRGYTGSTG